MYVVTRSVYFYSSDLESPDEASESDSDDSSDEDRRKKKKRKKSKKKKKKVKAQEGIQTQEKVWQFEMMKNTNLNGVKCIEAHFQQYNRYSKNKNGMSL